jgi:hypothetical protein
MNADAPDRSRLYFFVYHKKRAEIRIADPDNMTLEVMNNVPQIRQLAEENGVVGHFDAFYCGVLATDATLPAIIKDSYTGGKIMLRPRSMRYLPKS